MANSVSGTLGSATSGTEVVCTKATIILVVSGNTLDIEINDGTGWVVAESHTEDAVRSLDLDVGPVRMRVTCSTYVSGTARYTISGL